MKGPIKVMPNTDMIAVRTHDDLRVCAGLSMLELGFLST